MRHLLDVAGRALAHATVAAVAFGALTSAAATNTRVTSTPTTAPSTAAATTTVMSTAAVSSAAVSSAQAPRQLPQGALERHGRNLRLERRLAWMDEWFVASPEQREEARAIWQRLLSRGAQSAGTPPARMVGQLIRVLVFGARAAAADRTECLVADSVDLRVVPGAFEARDEGAGEAMTCFVRPLLPLVGERGMTDEIDFELVWVAENGEEISARREPIGRAAFDVQGFEMYIRPPRSAAGHWRLVPRVYVGEHRADGMGIEVECVSDLAERYRDLVAGLGPAGPVSTLHRAIVERIELGVRDFTMPSLEALFAGESRPAGSDLMHGARPHPLAEWGPGGARSWVLDDSNGDEPCREIVVSIASPEEAATWLFAGSQGYHWAQYAQEAHARIVSVDFDRIADLTKDLWEVIERERKTYPDARVTLVARQSSLMPLTFALMDAEVAARLSRVVYVSPIVRDQPPKMKIQCPWIFLEPLGESRLEQELQAEGCAAGLWVRRTTPGPIAEIELPDLLRR